MSRFILTISAAACLFATAVLPALPQSLRDLDMNAPATLNDDGVRRVQQGVGKKGIDPGPIDGIFGPRTKEAVRRFQDRYGIKSTGEVDNQTLFALGESELELGR